MLEGGSCNAKLTALAPSQAPAFNAIRSYLGAWTERDFPLPTRPPLRKTSGVNATESYPKHGAQRVAFRVRHT